MDLHFYDLINKISPFYCLIGLGFIAGRYFNVDRNSLANLLFYIIIPIVFFTFGMKLRIEADLFVLPILFFLVSVLLNRLYLNASERLWHNDKRANIIAYSAGTANTGYFGLPIALMLFDTETVAIYMLMNFGMSFYDYTVGAFTIARGQFEFMDAIKSVLKMPILYGFFLGLGFNLFGCKIPQNFEVLTNCFTNSYAILGMMMIGFGISHIKTLQMDWKFIIVLLSSRFIAAPAITIGLVALDAKYFNIFDHNIHLAAILTSIVPPAVNTIIFATIHKSYPQEAASAVLIGTIFALFYLPLMLSILF